VHPEHVLRRCAAICSIIAIQICAVPGAFAAPLPFHDMERTWFQYREAVQFLKDREVIHGDPEGTFRPRDPINRAEFLKLVFAGLGGGTPVQGACFSDVPADAWFAPFVCAAERRGIVGGYPDGTFQPARTVNVAEAMKMILKAAGKEIPERRGEKWYAPYVEEFDDPGILPAHSFLPWAELTRERAADLLYRFVRYNEDRIVLSHSVGCGKPAGTPPSAVTVLGAQRSYLLTVPDDYVSQEAAPLIIAFHGRTNSNEEVRSYYRLDREFDDAFIAYPAALENGNGSFSWADPGNTAYEIRDIAFFDAIVEQLAEQYCIDMDRIYVVGHSLGAWMANSVACVRGGIVRASATVGGDSVITDCAGPTAAMIMHNPHDTLAPFSGAERVRELRTKTNACTWDTAPAEPEEFKCVRHTSCNTGGTVIFCPHELDTDSRGDYYPHQWPRNTASAIADFFQDLR
jgi:polyhydroxybutyrate depolymerase